MKWISPRYRLVLAASTYMLLTAGLSACQEVIPTDEPGPLLVTLPAGGYAPTVTPTAADAPQPTSEPSATLVPQPNISTPTPVVQSVEAIRLLWTLEGPAHPVALAPAGSSVAVLLNDGRFLWVNAETGQVESTSFVWSGSLAGETTGDVYSDGQAAAVVATQIIPGDNEATARSRVRLVVFDTRGGELWSRAGDNNPRPLSAVLIAGTIIVGQADNLLAYDLQTGAEVWGAALPTPTATPSLEPTLRPTLAPTATPLPSITSYRTVQVDADQLYALIDSPAGSGAAVFDPFTGIERWRWLDSGSPFEQIAISDDGALILAATDRLAAVDAATGRLQWQISFSIEPVAGISVQAGVVQLAPAPTVEFDYRPGIMGMSVLDGTRLWQAFGGLLAGPLAGGEDYVWTLVKDYDQGHVSLSALDPVTGAEAARLPAGEHPEQSYRLVVQGRRVYVLSSDLKTFGY